MIPFQSTEYDAAAEALYLVARVAVAAGEVTSVDDITALAQKFQLAAVRGRQRETLNVTDEHNRVIPIDGKRRAR